MGINEITQNLIKKVNQAVSTQSETAVYYALSHAFDSISSHLFFIAKNDTDARRIADELVSFFDCPIMWYPKSQLTFHDLEAESSDIRAFRLKAIDAVLHEKKVIIVTTSEGLMTPLAPKEALNEITLSVGQTLDIESFTQNVVSMGYEKVTIVDGRGQISVRGGIVDIFPPSAESPFRIELFDNEIDSLRTFDVISQRSLDKINSARIMPAAEFFISGSETTNIIAKINKDLVKASKALSQASQAKLQSRVSNITLHLEEGVHSNFYKNYIPYISDKRTTLVDYCPDCRIVFFEPDLVLSDYENYVKGARQRFTDMLENGEVLPLQAELIPDVSEVVKVVASRPWLCHKAFLSQYRYLSPQALESVEIASTPRYAGSFETLLQDIIKWRKTSRDIFMFTGNEKRALVLKDFFNKNGIQPVIIAGLSDAESYVSENDRKPLFIIKNHLATGFIYETAVLIGDNEIFGTVKKASHTHKAANPIKSFTELTIGSYVVHETHGIARFLGIQTKEVDNKKQDYLTLEYANNDKVFVPVDRLDYIQPYISTDGNTPQLSRLGGKEWSNTKEKAAASIKKLAFDLVELYARREVFKGFKFSADTVWQRELEDSFIYEETDDQLRAIEEIKRDMEDYKIMDRLLCGDVGFGKTEVAVRAAFKAVVDGKQVAILAPTTILVQQHFQTFSERYKNFPVKVDFVSRFKSPADQKKTLAAVEAGEVDVLIGTHRLLSSDVHFKDLGLLVIDEEQRFGVNHKEKIKTLKKNIDVLTLSATPIPRTLHMSLVGIRDISVIDTPPRDRFPVQTYVIEDNDDIIRDAILRELERDGQMFFLYNDVSSMDRFRLKLQALVPEARIASAHGQMSETQLERIMMDYFNHEYDILLCSTIIESGIDVPNANTLFVYDADKLGLSQLYQIRGRIGRSTRVAYAYLIYRRDKVLSEVATTRLKTLKEFTDLGSGFRIAMRDLEIRGAGNVIGAEQSGHMTSIGYDLYCKMLADEVAKLKGKTSDDPIEVTINVASEAYIPQSYIREENVRLEMYKKISLITSRKDKYSIEEEIEDRYSNIPQEVYNLTNIAYIRWLCRLANVTKVKQKGDAFELTFVRDNFNPQAFGAISPKHKVSIKLDLNSGPKITLMMKDTRPAKRLEELAAICEEMFDKENQSE